MIHKLNTYIDHTDLSPDASTDDIVRLCEEAKEHHFAAVCVNPVWVKTAAQQLKGSDVAVCSVVGFPSGAHKSEVKVAEAQLALDEGADELDTVINIAALKAADHEGVRADIEPLAQLAHENGAILKVILEVALLSDEEIERASRWAAEFGADYIKTSTGMLKGENSGATVAAVELMRDSVDPQIGIKAAGGIRDRATAEAMIEAGATRLGTSSSISFIEED